MTAASETSRYAKGYFAAGIAIGEIIGVLNIDQHAVGGKLPAVIATGNSLAATYITQY